MLQVYLSVRYEEKLVVALYLRVVELEVHRQTSVICVMSLPLSSSA